MPAWVAPLVGPAVDLSVVGLLVAVRHLSLCGVPRRQLRPARALLVFCGAATLALNIAEPMAARAYGRAAFDSVGPLLLLFWSEVGPGLLQQVHAVRQAPGVAGRRRLTPRMPGAGGGQRAGGRRTAVPPSCLALPESPDPSSAARPDGEGHPPSVRRYSHDDLLVEARRIDIRHRAQHEGHPASAETIRKRLRVGATAARALVDEVRARYEDGTGVHSLQ